eukprot:981903-Alexandrium_andersonii.AAC.1
MPWTSSGVAGASSGIAGNAPRGVTGLSTPNGAPERIHGAESASGSPATLANASKNSVIRPGPVPGAGCPKACRTFIRSPESSCPDRPGGLDPSLMGSAPSVSS